MVRRLASLLVVAACILSMSFSAGPVKASGILSFPEPFDFHYPGEREYDSIGDSVQLRMTVGEVASSTFVYTPSNSGEMKVFANDLVGSDGSILPREDIDVGVVTYMNRGRSQEYLGNIWLRGGNQDVEKYSPTMPMAIVPDEQDFLNNVDDAAGSIRLRVGSNTSAVARAGQGTQFWVSVRAPASPTPEEMVRSYRGHLDLEADGRRLSVPVEAEVLQLPLDDLDDHGRHIGVFQAVDQFDAVFRDAVLTDLVDHGVNALFHRKATVDDYEYFREYGIEMVLNADNLYLSRDDIAEIARLGFEPLFYGFDEPNHNNNIDSHIAASREIRAEGGRIGTSGSVQALRQIDPVAPQDWWNLEFSTAWSTDEAIFDHLDAVRADPKNKIARRESVYPMTLLELYPLNTRLLYGLWLYRSNLDGGFAWAYSSDSRSTNPYTRTDWNGVAFPAEFYDSHGRLHSRRMLSSYVWEAFRAGVTDMRYALTVDRLLVERGSAADREEFEQLLRNYDQVFSGPEQTRIDVLNPNSTVRATRENLFALLVQLAEGSQR